MYTPLSGSEIIVPDGYELVDVESVDLLGNFDDEWVYDIDVGPDSPYFFANNMLVHNSCYASMTHYMLENKIEMTEKNAIELANEIGKKTNASMPGFLSKAFFLPQERGKIINANREIVGRRGLFKNKKKRYAIFVIDKENKPVSEKDEMKIMGMETRRSDTPKMIQKFLEECLIMVVKENKSYEEVRSHVDAFRKSFREMPAWKKGSPNRAKALSMKETHLGEYEEMIQDGHLDATKPTIPLGVKAAINTNRLIEQYGEHRWAKISDGDKVESIYLRPNHDNIDCVAIKTGETYVPEWFKALPFDEEKMEEKLVDKKLFNVIGEILDWDFTPCKTARDEVVETYDDFFD